MLGENFQRAWSPSRLYLELLGQAALRLHPWVRIWLFFVRQLQSLISSTFLVLCINHYWKLLWSVLCDSIFSSVIFGCGNLILVASGGRICKWMVYGAWKSALKICATHGGGVWQRFWHSCGTPNEPKINQKSNSDAVENEKIEISVFYTPPLQNQYFWLPMEAKMEPQRRLEAVFTAIESNGTWAILYRDLLETFLHPEPPREDHWFQARAPILGRQLYIDIY